MTHGRCSSRSRPSPRSGGRATGPSYPGRHQPRSSRPYSAPSACTSSVLPVRSRAADSSDHPLVDTRPSRPAPTPRQSVLRSAPVLDGALHFDRADHHPDSPASDQPAALDPKEHGEAAEAPQLRDFVSLARRPLPGRMSRVRVSSPAPSNKPRRTWYSSAARHRRHSGSRRHD
jgi:hypothetical protein